MGPSRTETVRQMPPAHSSRLYRSENQRPPLQPYREQPSPMGNGPAALRLHGGIVVYVGGKVVGPWGWLTIARREEIGYRPGLSTQLLPNHSAA